MRTGTGRIHQLLTCLLIIWITSSAGAQSESPYIRIVEPDSDTIRLDVAVRTLAPPPETRTIIQLIGAVHIGDASYYASLQSILDIHDLVLYEGVGGGWETIAEPQMGNEAAAMLSARRVQFLAMLGEVMHREEGRYPESGKDYIEYFTGGIENIVAQALIDGWGRDVLIEPNEFDIVSLGADGLSGGDDLNADIRGRLLLKARSRESQGRGSEGFQNDIAEALGLAFQLDEIDYSQPHWRNSDMDIGEIQEALGGPPAQTESIHNGGLTINSDEPPDGLQAADALFQTLSGESFLAKTSAFLLKIIGANPTGRAMVKIMLADTLTQADKLLTIQPDGLADLMDVIIHERNNAVLEDLRMILADEPDVGTLAIFYGAGHFSDLEAQIVEEFGYTYEGTLWLPAITIDLAEAGLTAKQVSLYRSMMKRMIDTQIELMQGK